MYSLYHSLLAQHPRQLVSVPCASSTIAQLQHYFEDVVVENSLSALVVESLPMCQKRSSHDLVRLKELDQAAKNLFMWISPGDELSGMLFNRGKGHTKSIFFDHTEEANPSERFVVIADARFSALLASVRNPDATDSSRDLVIWTFEPDIVYSALEYLMARVTAEHPFHANSFAQAVGVSMPKATSLQLTLGVTTKLTRLLQEQTEREIAVNRLATAIRNTLELDGVLQTAADEVGRALKVHSCVVRVEGALVGDQVTKCYLRPDDNAGDEETLVKYVDSISERLMKSPESYVVEADEVDSVARLTVAVVPLIHQGNYIGALVVRSDDPTRVWTDSELLLLHTVADQLVVAVNQAHLFAQMQKQALTDSLTSCYNRRSFELQLERDLHLATRMRQPLSLIMVDFDNFKGVNDRAGHDAGDIALRMLADALRAELRAVDTAARFGGDEFVVILPQASTEGAVIVAERLRSRVEQMVVPGFGHVTSSLGVATFPNHASSRDTLVVAADRALYSSKNAGRNRVSVAEPSFPIEEEAPVEMANSIH
jgi:diguanylate cyclase (GGDEF)-like protein